MKYDLLIAGFGTAGSIAAIAAARRGASVLVLEKNTYPGGTHTGGFLPGYYLQPASGLMAEIDAMVEKRIAGGTWAGGRTEVKKYILEEEALRYGATIRYGAIPTAVEVRDGAVTGVTWYEGTRRYSAEIRQALDATGEAALCRLAGCELTGGRASDGQFQPFTNTMCRRGERSIGAANFDAGRIDQTSAEELSAGMLETLLVHLSDDYTKSMELLAPSDLPGIREGVHIVSEQQLTMEDFFSGSADCAEVVGYAYSNIDTHANDMPFESTLFQDWMIGCSMWGTALWFPLPRRALVPRGFRNLQAASRCWGVDHDLGHALRMNAAMGTIGEAAAEWAVLAANRNCALLEVPYGELAARLPLPPSPLPENDRFLKLDAEAVRSGLAGKTPGFAQWSSLRLPREMLLSWFAEAEDSDFKRHLAFALALRNEPAVLPLLRRMFAQRDPFQPETSRKYNHARGYVALYFLGRLADAESVEPIGQVLLDQQSDHRYEYASHAIGALLRIGQAHPERRAGIGAILRKFAEDPDQILMARLKGTADTMKRMDGAFRITVARTLNDWGIPHRVGETLQKLPLDFHERRMAERLQAR